MSDETFTRDDLRDAIQKGLCRNFLEMKRFG